MPFDLSLTGALWVGLMFLVAAFVRGYSGFGFAALAISGAGLVTNPLNLVAVVIVADIVLTAQQARGILPDVDWRRVGFLLLGAIPGVPIGVWAMAAVPPDLARGVISTYVLVMCGLLWSGWRIRHTGPGAHAATAVVSGLANGAAVGGLPVAVFFAAQSLSAATFRATLIAYFTLLDLWTLPNVGWRGLIGWDTVVATLVYLPVMVGGVWAGSRHFMSANPQDFRRFAIMLLAVLATLGLGKSVL